jgi:SulP family sulfate permease
LEHFLREETARGVTVLLAGVRTETVRVLTNVGLETWFPASQVFPEEEEQYSATLKAVRFAVAKLRAARADTSATQAQVDAELTSKLYYLV